MAYKHWNICKIFHHITIQYLDVAVNTLHNQTPFDKFKNVDREIITKISEIVNNINNEKPPLINIKSGFIISGITKKRVFYSSVFSALLTP